MDSAGPQCVSVSLEGLLNIFQVHISFDVRSQPNKTYQLGPEEVL